MDHFQLRNKMRNTRTLMHKKAHEYNNFSPIPPENKNIFHAIIYPEPEILQPDQIIFPLKAAVFCPRMTDLSAIPERSNGYDF